MSVLLLGATSPIAEAIGHRYASEGYDIYAAARDAEEAEAVASDIALRHDVESAGGHFDALEFDRHDDFVDEVESAVGPVDVAVVAFGVMPDQKESQEDFELARRTIDVNYTGAASMCEALARRMIDRETGAIVGISSVAGDRGRQSNYFYGSAKGAFRLYLQGLRNRCFEHDVQVLCVKPGFVDTPMTFGMETAIPIASPEDVADSVVRAQQKGKDTMYVPWFWAWIMLIIKSIPEAIFKRLSL